MTYKRKISKAFVAKVKRHIAKKWHDQAWWDFQDHPDFDAVLYALSNAAPDYDYDLIIQEAVLYALSNAAPDEELRQ